MIKILCLTCHRSVERGDMCSHVDCPYRPVAWSDIEDGGRLPHINGDGEYVIDEDDDSLPDQVQGYRAP